MATSSQTRPNRRRLRTRHIRPGHYQHWWAISEHRNHIIQAKKRTWNPEKQEWLEWFAIDTVKQHLLTCALCSLSKWRKCNCKANSLREETENESN